MRGLLGNWQLYRDGGSFDKFADKQTWSWVMKLKKLIPSLMVQDVQSSIEFYKTFLNFKLVKTIPDTEPFDWAKMKCGATEIALQSQDIMAFDIPEMQGLVTGSTILFYVEVDDIDALYAQVKDNVEI